MPELNVDSMRQTATAALVASHNCGVLLQTLAGRADLLGYQDAETHLTSALDAAQQERNSWLSVARTLDQVTADVENCPSSEVQDARDLALWTGRLAHADPSWTIATSPTQSPREAEDLAPDREHATAVITAVHEACDALAQLSQAQASQARAAGRSGRYLVPASWLPDYSETSRRFVSAPAHRMSNILAAYDQTRRTSSHAQRAMAHIADAEPGT